MKVKTRRKWKLTINKTERDMIYLALAAERDRAADGFYRGEVETLLDQLDKAPH